MQVITSIDEALGLVGSELGVTDWFTIDQERIDQFGTTTLDRQWIHVDVDRARTESPYGTTIAHGFLTLSLIPGLSKGTYRVENAKMGINYGLNKVRFLSPVRTGSRIRLRSSLTRAERVDDSTINLTLRHTIEIDGVDKPAAVADMIARYAF